jgi:hypothetical protein
MIVEFSCFTWTWRSLQGSWRNVVLTMSPRGGKLGNKKTQRIIQASRKPSTESHRKMKYTESPWRWSVSIDTRIVVNMTFVENCTNFIFSIMHKFHSILREYSGFIFNHRIGVFWVFFRVVSFFTAVSRAFRLASSGLNFRLYSVLRSIPFHSVLQTYVEETFWGMLAEGPSRSCIPWSLKAMCTERPKDSLQEKSSYCSKRLERSKDGGCVL